VDKEDVMYRIKPSIFKLNNNNNNNNNMPLLRYRPTVKHFFDIPPASVVWPRTTSYTGALATDYCARYMKNI
jgi:hypothetical protein